MVLYIRQQTDVTFEQISYKHKQLFIFGINTAVKLVILEANLDEKALIHIFAFIIAVWFSEILFNASFWHFTFFFFFTIILFNLITALWT